jgi:hypothetical protein
MSPAPQVVSDNPNASVLLFTGAVVTVVLWGASAAGIEIPDEIQNAILTIIGTVVLYVGKRKA